MPNDVDVSAYTVTFLDYSGEKSTTQVNVRSLADNPAFNVASQEFEDQLVAHTLGTKNKASAFVNYAYSSSNPGNVNAQREDKLLVRYQDNVTGKNYSFTVPTFDRTSLSISPGTDEIDITEGTATDLVSAIEAFVASPAGNAVTVTGMRNVSRNI